MPGFIQSNVVGNYLSGREAADSERASSQIARARDQQYEQNVLAQQQNQQQLSDEQHRAFATKMVQAAQYGLQSQQPKSFIEQNYPQLAQLAGAKWQTATDDDVRSSLQDAIGKFGPQAGIGPAAPAKKEAYTLSPGQKRFEDGQEVASVDPRPAGKGISMTMPDGTEVQIGGDGVPNYGGVGLTKPNQTKLQDAFINAQGNAYALREQLAKYRDEFSTVGGQLKAGIAQGKEMLGMENAPQQKQFLSDFTSWKADTASLLSQYLNQLSGAAISPAEEARLKGGFPSAEDSPTQYKAKADSTMKRFALVQARSAYLLSNPAQSMDSVSLDGMSNIIAKEANRLAQSLERGGMTAEAAKQKAIADTRSRFGLNQ